MSTNPTPDTLRQSLHEVYQWRQQWLKGDEKGEAASFLDRIFRAFGHASLQEAGATLEYRLKKENAKGTAFADLMWKPRCLVEMKKAGVDLRRTYRQAFDYWVQAVPDRPRYVVLCNFDEFWIYDFHNQLDEPVDRVLLADLPARWESLAFLLPQEQKPAFGNDLVAVTRDAAAKVAAVFNGMQLRGVARPKAQQFSLQCVMAMFAEDIGLLPGHLFTAALEESLAASAPSDRAYDLIFGLFREMNLPGRTTGGRYKGTPYFNGGLFADTDPFDIVPDELADLRTAAMTNWSAVRPEIFGTLFEQSMDADDRHAYGAHFTSQADIAKIVVPCIVTPWRARIEEARTRGSGGIKAMERVLGDMFAFRVLDPAVGSGNFLYVAYREMRRLEHEALTAIAEMRSSPDIAAQRSLAYVTPDHFFGMDVNRFAVEVAKVTMMLAKKLAADELEDDQDVLPLDNLDASIVASDALFDPWPKADVIIGNPPYLGRRKMVEELGPEYTQRLAEAHPHVSGVSDFVSYWFPLAHDHLPDGGRAGLVATNSVRQNESRKASLDYVVDHGGVIFDAVSSQPWSGDAAVHVSIINWSKGGNPSDKILWLNDGELRLPVDEIPSSLSPEIDVRTAAELSVNKSPQLCFQGQTPGVAKGFLVDASAADPLIHESIHVRPYLGGDELLKRTAIDKWIIDLPMNELIDAETEAPQAVARLRTQVLPVRRAASDKEVARNKALAEAKPGARGNRHHSGFLDRWWRLGYRREELLAAIAPLERYIATSRVASEKRTTVFTFVDSRVRPGDALTVFALDDDYSFGVMSSALHRRWLEARCSTLETRLRYTSTTVWDSFPWPQTPSASDVAKIVGLVRDLLDLRADYLDRGISLARQYDVLRTPGKSRLRDLHRQLDEAVTATYGFTDADDDVAQLLALNQDIAADVAHARGPGGAGLEGSKVSDYRLVAPGQVPAAQ